MEKKTIRSGAPFVFAGAGVMAVELPMGIGSLVSYPVALAVGGNEADARAKAGNVAESLDIAIV